MVNIGKCGKGAMVLDQQECSSYIWDMKYRYMNGNEDDVTVDGTFIRVANSLASEEHDDVREYWFDKFLWALRNGGVLGGRIMSNAGVSSRAKSSTINCAVSTTIHDTRSSIMEACSRASATLQSGAGIGMYFSTLRPKNAVVRESGTVSSGPISFMGIFDAMCKTIRSGGGRRGAQMGTFAIHHPDIIDFITAKRKRGVLQHFNLSVLITSEFMEAVKSGSDWPLYFPAHTLELASPDSYDFVYKYWPITEGYKTDDKGRVCCRVYNTVKANELYDLIATSTYTYAEPGFILIDSINELNNNWFCENITATNPCLPGTANVHTHKGIVPISTLKDKKFMIPTLDGSWASAYCWENTGPSTLIRMTFDNGLYSDSTPDHKWPVYDNVEGGLVKYATKDLVVGQKIPKNTVRLPRLLIDLSIDPLKDAAEGFVLGVLYGIGYKKYEDGEVAFECSNVADAFISSLNTLGFYGCTVDRSLPNTVMVFFGSCLCKLPKIVDHKLADCIWTGTDTRVKSFLDGFVCSSQAFFRSTGSVKESRLSFKDDSGFITDLAKFLSFMGIVGDLTDHSDGEITLNLGLLNIDKLGTLVSFTGSKLSDFFKGVNRYVSEFVSDKEHNEHLYMTIESFSSICGTNVVYDINVNHHTHMFPTDWSWTGNCVVEGTLVNTPKGLIPVEQVKIGSEISTINNREPVDSIEHYENIQVYRVDFNDGYSTEVTAAHRFHKVSKQNGAVTDQRLDEMKVGDLVRYVSPTLLEEGGVSEHRTGFIYGLLAFADLEPDLSSISVVLRTPTESVISLIKSLVTVTGEHRLNSGLTRLVIESGTLVPGIASSIFKSPKSMRTVDVCVFNTSMHCIGFLDACFLLSCVLGNGNTTDILTFDTESQDLVQCVRHTLAMVGCRVLRIVKNQTSNFMTYRLIVGGRWATRFVRMSMISTILGKEFWFTGSYSEYDPPLTETASILNIEATRKANVYDLYCNGSDTWITGGIVQRGCGEVPLPPDGTCWTGDMLLTTQYGIITTNEAHKIYQSGRPLAVAVDEIYVGVGNKTRLHDCTIVETGSREVSRYSFSCGQQIELTGDHRVSTPIGWKKICDVSVGEVVHVRSRESDTLDLIPDFVCGMLSFVLVGIPVVNRKITLYDSVLIADVLPLLEEYDIGYSVNDTGVVICADHPAIPYVLEADISNIKVARGYIHMMYRIGNNIDSEYSLYPTTYKSLNNVIAALKVIGVTIPEIEDLSSSGLISILDKLQSDIDTTVQVAHGLNAVNQCYSVYGYILFGGRVDDSSVSITFCENTDGIRGVLGSFSKMANTAIPNMVTSVSDDRTSICVSIKSETIVSHIKSVFDLDSYETGGLRVPSNVFKAEHSTLALFLSAAFCSMGLVSKESGVTLCLTSGGLIRDTQQLLLEFGIRSDVVKLVTDDTVVWRLSIYERSLYAFHRFIGFTFNTKKQVTLTSIVREKKLWGSKSHHNETTLTHIEPMGKRTVYDIEEPKTNSLIVNGFVVHNCLLGSVNLPRFVKHPFTEKAYFDYGTYQKVVRIMCRMIDNVIPQNGLPLEEQVYELEYKRRHGLGYLGLGSALVMLRIRYGSQKAVEFTEDVTKRMAIYGYEEGLKLAIEKGPAPIMNQDFVVTKSMLEKRPALVKDGVSEGQKLSGKELIFGYSKYMDKIRSVDPDLVERLRVDGCRYTHHTAIAPTGCVTPNTLVLTSCGLLRISELGDVNGEQWQDIRFSVSTDEGYRDATKFYVNGMADVLRITTHTGRTITSTFNHQFRVFDPDVDGAYSWRSSSDIKTGDIIIGLANNYPENVVDKPTKHVGLVSEKCPKSLDEDIARFVGWIHGNGNIDGDIITVNAGIDSKDSLFTMVETVLGQNFSNHDVDSIVWDQHICGTLVSVSIKSEQVVGWLYANGLISFGAKAPNLPKLIMCGSRQTIHGYASGYFISTLTGVGAGSSNVAFLRDMQVLFQSIGILTRVLHVDSGKGFLVESGYLIASNERNNTVVSCDDSYQELVMDSGVSLAFHKYRKNNTSIDNATPIKDIVAAFEATIEHDVVYDVVCDVEQGLSDTYDISVPSNVTYTANGIVSHNTISLAFANNASGGVEPSFSHQYVRNVDVGKKTKKKVNVVSHELWEYRRLIDPDASIEKGLPSYFVGSDDVDPREHIDMQSAAQKWVDGSISKCVVSGTRIITNIGPVRVENIGYANIAGEFGSVRSDITHAMCSDGKFRSILRHYYDGYKPAKMVTFNTGHQISGSLPHRVMGANGWVKLEDLEVGDTVVCRRPDVSNSMNAGGLSIDPKSSFAFGVGGMTPNLAKTVGVILSNLKFNVDSSIMVSFSGTRIGSINNYECPSSEFIKLLKQFNVNDVACSNTYVSDNLPADGTVLGYVDVEVYTSTMVEFIRDTCFDSWGNIQVPEQIMCGSIDEVLAFLDGFMLDCTHVTSKHILINDTEPEFARQVFSLISSIGLLADIIDYDVEGVKSKSDVIVYDFAKFRHKASIASIPARRFVPIPNSVKDFQIPTGERARCDDFALVRDFKAGYCDVCRPETLDSLGVVYDKGVYAITVVKIEDTVEQQLYDIEVEETHDYLVDGIISHNTINVSTDYPYEKFKDLYMYGYDKGLKGCTTFRFNPEMLGVIVKEEDLKNTTYSFKLLDGTTVTAKGTDDIEYRGEVHNAANLYTAIINGEFD